MRFIKCEYGSYVNTNEIRTISIKKIQDNIYEIRGYYSELTDGVHYESILIKKLESKDEADVWLDQLMKGINGLIPKRRCR